MTLLSRSKLLKKEKFEIRKVDLGKGEHVFVRQMSGRERDSFEQSLIKENKDAEGGFEKTLEDFRAKLAVVTVCNEQGKLLLELRDSAILSMNMSAARLERIVEVSQDMNKISEEDKEGLLKNSKGDQSANSTSDSVKK